MSLFKKKSSDAEIPEIPSLPPMPSYTLISPKQPIDLPTSKGDIDNQEAIMSAVDSSEKIDGDSGAIVSPSESFSIPPISSIQMSTPPQNQKPLSIPVLPAAPVQPKPLPEVPKYEARQPVFSSALPTPPFKESPMVNPFIKPVEPINTMSESVMQPEEKFVKRDATDSIFVRIDKFNSAKRDVDEIGRDLRQITQVIEKINDIKLKEDEEITEINKTLEEIKNRINRIDVDVFNRI